jgi:hypothetical protein
MNHLLALANLQEASTVFVRGSYGSSQAIGMVAWIPVGLMLCVVAIVALVTRARTRRRRLDLLQEALRNPSLSPQAQVELVRALQPNSPRRWMFSLGWLGLFAGIGWLCTDPRRDELTAAIIVTVASFAFVTLPIALRELDARSA